MATTYLTRTPSSTGNQQIFTFSFWIKRSSLGNGGTGETIFSQYYTADDDQLRIEFTSNDEFRLYNSAGSADYINLKTNRRFRDTSAWYHIVCAFDTTQSTETNRTKIYVNGVQETSFNASGLQYPILNRLIDVSEQTPQLIGVKYSGSYNTYFNGLMSYFAFVDGTQELPTIFGETDSTTGEWEIKTSITPSVAWGTNGYLVLKNGNSVTDQSGNANNFTVGGGTLTNTEDNPSNVFATLNPLDASRLSNTGNTFSNGNLTVTDGSSNYLLAQSTLAATTGKFYWEVKINSTGSDNSSGLGIVDVDNFTRSDGAANSAYGWIYAPSGDKRHNGTSTSYGDTYAANDIIGIALDLTNGFLYFSKNGTWQNSGNPESGASGTNAAYGSISSTIAAHAYDGSSSIAHEYSFNFGNGFFGTTAISSEGTNASGIGKFEYDVPTGYTALSTKGLNL